MTANWSKTTVLFFCLLCRAVAGEQIRERVDYFSQIKPLLAEKCYSCHSALQQEAELRLDAQALMLTGGDTGPVVIPGDSSRSLLVERITAAEDSRMPPAAEGSRLTATEVALIRSWIDQGAEAPDEPILADPRQHWAFQPPVRPAVPEEAAARSGSHDDPLHNPIDAFLAAGRQRQGLVPLDSAPPEVLLRRVYLDLIGLPPTRGELHAFLADPSDEAYRSVVLDLLKRPAHGERWGRHWMDVWRYSDWYGLGAQVRYSQKHIWRWRDWIIQSLNDDKPYRRMVLEMLAGDEIAPTDPAILPATGFLARNYFLFNRTTWLDNTVEHTSKALLGLTINCARCHDHKYDPIKQTDYYRLRAVFEPHQVRVDPVPGQIDLNLDGLPRAFDNDPDTPTYVFVRGNEKEPDKSRVIGPGVPSIFSAEELQPATIALPRAAYAPGSQSFALADHLAAAEDKIKAASDSLAQADQQLAAAEAAVAENEVAAASVADQPARVAAQGSPADKSSQTLGVAAARLALATAARTLAAARLHPAALKSAHAADLAKLQPQVPPELDQLVERAALAARKYEQASAAAAVARAEQELSSATATQRPAARKKLDQAKQQLASAAAAVETPGTEYTSLYVSLRAANGMIDEATPRHGPYSQVSTGRRTELARWIVDRQNPLTARVAVNHLWLRHFGQPLVPSMTDFGLRTPRPPQHRLLDWLAVEFMEHNWSMKYLHRLIVTSRAYRLESSLLGADPATRQADPTNAYYWRRLPQRMESQVIRDSMLYLAGVLDTRMGGPTVDPKQESTTYRRSLYFTHSRDDRAAFLDMFDDADILRCYRRKTSIVPQQALALANSKLSLSMARQITAVLYEELGPTSDADFVQAAFETVLLVKPTSNELAACLQALEQTRQALATEDAAARDGRARQNLVHALLNHNDFVTIR